ncbi:hypothetical protein [Hymenobacter cavernae]|uniref:Uncharacterized protein n=1 Tax=Hymenobacter cavernae TaxID=2044852 RepID=A0ABQ1TVE0_9BACT|nr:hypothetical protein [Hymenobacter cavernae]GGF02060.1 hypothetical protein GCM10011383_11200 [Hymenobacter cavernae]
MTKNLLLSGLALATLALNACSSEPSDWRPDKKVSVDMVAPGTRTDEDFDKGSDHETNQARGGAIAEPISSHATLDARPKPSAEQATSANAEEVMRTKDKTDAGKRQAKPSQEDTTAGGHEVQR